MNEFFAALKAALDAAKVIRDRSVLGVTYLRKSERDILDASFKKLSTLQIKEVDFHAPQATVNGALVTDMTLPTDFWTISSAPNGNLYSAYPTGVVPTLTWAAIPNFLNRSTSLSVNIQTTYLTPTAGAVVTVVGSLPSGWAFNGTTLTYDGVTVNGSITSFFFRATYLGLTQDSNSISIQGVGSPVADTLAPTIPLGTALLSPATASQVVVGGYTPSDPNQSGHTWGGIKRINVKRTPPGSVIGNVTIGPGNQPILVTGDIGPQTSSVVITGADVAITTTAKDNPYPTIDARAYAAQQLTGTSWAVMCRIPASFANSDQYSNVRLEARATLATNSAYVASICFPFAQGVGLLGEIRAAAGGNAAGLNSVANSTGPAYLFIIRSADTYQLYGSLDGVSLINLGAATQAMGNTVYVMAAAVTNAGVSMSVTIEQLSISTLANWTYTDSTVAASTGYTYTAQAEDNASNQSAFGTAISVTTPSVTSGITFTPGLGFEDSQNVHGYASAFTPFSQFDYFVANPNPYLTNVKTMVIELNWGCQEQTKGVYAWDAVDHGMALAITSGVKLVVYMRWEAVPFQSIATAFSLQYYPAYLNDAAGANVYGGALPIYFGTTFGGSITCFTRPAVRQAFGNMLVAMGNHIVPGTGLALKDHPLFEGIVFVETSYNLSTGPYDGYGSQQAWDDAYVIQYNANIATARSAFPNKLVAVRANWGTSANVISIGQTLLANKAGAAGGTDGYTVYPTDMDNVLNGTIGGVNYRAQIPICPFSETSGFAPNATPAQFFNWVKNSAHAHYFWPQRYSEAPVFVFDGWNNSGWSAMQAGYLAAGGMASFNTTKPTSYP